jgi:hypothetical protein
MIFETGQPSFVAVNYVPFPVVHGRLTEVKYAAGGVGGECPLPVR